MEKEQLFDDGSNRYPISRDWAMPEIKCLAKNCVANYYLQCSMPSRIVIDEFRQCKGFIERK